MSDVDLVRARNPLAEVAGEVTELKGKGTLVGLCPLHDEDTASFYVYPGDGGFYCFGCGVGGDVFTFVQRLEGVDFPGALEYLADRAGVELNDDPPDPRVVEYLERLEREVAEARPRLGKQYRDYLKGRGLNDNTIARLRIGLAGDFRSLILPVLRHGRPVYLIRHDPEADRKYLFPKGEERPLVLSAGLSRTETAYVVEGWFDWAVMDQAGFPTIALLGSPANRHVEELSDFEDLVLLLDGDGPGRAGAEKLARGLYPAARIASLPDGMDPNDLAVDQGDGLELAVRRLAKESADALDLQLRTFEESEDLADLSEAYDLVATLPVGTTEEDMAVGKIHEVARGHGVRKKTIRADVERARKDRLMRSLKIEAARARECEPQPEDLLKEGREIVEAEDQLSLVRARLKSGFYFAGDTRAAELLWLVFHSRHLARPVNVVVHAPSAAGKSYTLETVSTLHPDEATYDLTSSSERALVYSEEPTEHRYVVVAEAAGLHRDGIGATIIRELAWGGRGIRYETVEKVDGELKARVIEKPGPTGLITTTTKDLDPEVATRLLRVTVTDSPAQTREVFRSLARKAERDNLPDPDLNDFRAAARWLEHEGERRVVVPFAGRLAELVPNDDVRLRRDFEQILTVVRVHAFVHQRNRTRTDTGAIEANEDDYRAAHRLLAGVMAVTLDDVTDAVRETVEKIVELTTDLPADEGVSGRDLADELGLSPSGVSYRVKAAGNLIVNMEKRDGYAARYRPGEPLPDARPVLPEPTQIFNPSKSFEHSNAPGERGATTGKNTVQTPVQTGGPVQSNTPHPSNTPSNGDTSRNDGEKSEGVQTFERNQGDDAPSVDDDDEHPDPPGGLDLWAGGPTEPEGDGDGDVEGVTL